MSHFTQEIAGAIILLLRSKCKQARAKSLETSSSYLEKYTIESMVQNYTWIDPSA